MKPIVLDGKEVMCRNAAMRKILHCNERDDPSWLRDQDAIRPGRRHDLDLLLLATVVGIVALIYFVSLLF